MRKNVPNSNETCILIGSALALDLVANVASDNLTNYYILKAGSSISSQKYDNFQI